MNAPLSVIVIFIVLLLFGLFALLAALAMECDRLRKWVERARSTKLDDEEGQ